MSSASRLAQIFCNCTKHVHMSSSRLLGARYQLVSAHLCSTSETKVIAGEAFELSQVYTSHPPGTRARDNLDGYKSPWLFGLDSNSSQMTAIGFASQWLNMNSLLFTSTHNISSKAFRRSEF